MVVYKNFIIFVL